MYLRREPAGQKPVLPILALLVALMLLQLSPAGCGDEKPLPPPAGEEHLPAPAVPGLSADQSRAVDESGYPDHFFISMDPVTSDRIERWVYYAPGKVLDFDNGRLFGEEPAENESAEYPPSELRPQDFTALTTPEEASQLLGEPLYTHEVRDSLMHENTIIVYDKAVLLYREDRLIGVETQVRPPRLPGD